MSRHKSVMFTGGEMIGSQGVKFFEVVAVEDIAVGGKSVSAGMTGFWAPWTFIPDSGFAPTPHGMVTLDGKMYESHPDFVFLGPSDDRPIPRSVTL